MIDALAIRYEHVIRHRNSLVEIAKDKRASIAKAQG